MGEGGVVIYYSHCTSPSLPHFLLPSALSLPLSLTHSPFTLSICPSPSIYLSIYLFIYLYLSIYPHIYLYLYLFIYLSTYTFIYFYLLYNSEIDMKEISQNMFSFKGLIICYGCQWTYIQSILHIV